MTYAKRNKTSEKSSTINVIFAKRQISEEVIEYNKTEYISLMDLTKKFDSVISTDVEKFSNGEKVLPYILSIVAELNTINYTRILIECRKTRSLAVQSGISQGVSLSLILFHLIMDKLKTEVKNISKGYSLGN